MIWVCDKLPVFISKTLWQNTGHRMILVGVVYQFMLSLDLSSWLQNNWCLFVLGEPQKVSEIDKSMVRENILGFIVQVPPLLRYIN